MPTYTTHDIPKCIDDFREHIHTAVKGGNQAVYNLEDALADVSANSMAAKVATYLQPLDDLKHLFEELVEVIPDDDVIEGIVEEIRDERDELAATYDHIDRFLVDCFNPGDRMEFNRRVELHDFRGAMLVLRSKALY